MIIILISLKLMFSDPISSSKSQVDVRSGEGIRRIAIAKDIPNWNTSQTLRTLECTNDFAL